MRKAFASQHIPRHKRVNKGILWRALEIEPVPRLALQFRAQRHGHALTRYVVGEDDNLKPSEAKLTEPN